MVKGLYTAYTGMINEQNRMDVLTNNLANSDTNGFKKEGATSQAFDSLLALKIKDRSENPNLAHPIGIANLGVKIGENYTDFSQGAFKVTDRTYDVALAGDGFFNIEYTNNTHLHVRMKVLNFWSYEADEVTIKGRFDLTVKLPPVPAGTAHHCGGFQPQLGLLFRQ